MPSLSNITRTIKNHKLSKFIAVIAVVLTAAVGIIKNFDELRKIFSNGKNDFAQIITADFQNPAYNEIILRISNPKSSKESFTEFTLNCEDSFRNKIRYFASNNTNNPYISKLYVPNARYAPITIEAGGIENISLQFPKFNSSTHSETCIKMSVNWIDNTGSLRKSEIVEMAKNTSSIYRTGTKK